MQAVLLTLRVGNASVAVPLMPIVGNASARVRLMPMVARVWCGGSS